MVEWRINILGHPSRLLEPRGMMYSIWQNRAWTNSLPLPTDWKGPVQTSRESPSLLWVLWEFVSYVAESRGHYTQSPNPINSTCGMCSFMSNSLKPHRLSPSRLSVHGISQQEYRSGLPFPSPGDLPDLEIEPVSPALAGRFFTAEPLGKLLPKVHRLCIN